MCASFETYSDSRRASYYPGAGGRRGRKHLLTKPRILQEDTTPPSDRIDLWPTTAGGVTSFVFSVNEAGAMFRCGLDGGVYVRCTSPQRYRDLFVGRMFSGLCGGTGKAPVDATCPDMDRRVRPAARIVSKPRLPRARARDHRRLNGSSAGGVWVEREPRRPRVDSVRCGSLCFLRSVKLPALARSSRCTTARRARAS